MARIRSIKPEFFTSLTIADLTVEQRLTFIGLWTHVDDEGRCVDDSRLIKAAIWPLDDRTAAVGQDIADRYRALDSEAASRRTALDQEIARRRIDLDNELTSLRGTTEAEVDELRAQIAAAESELAE